MSPSQASETCASASSATSAREFTIRTTVRECQTARTVRTPQACTKSEAIVSKQHAGGVRTGIYLYRHVRPYLST
jgi:hypothetical protein